MSKPRLLTLYFTKNETTFKPLNFRSVLYQKDIEQDVYVISAEPVNLIKYGFNVPNIVISTKTSWPVPIRIGYSFNVALRVLENRYSVKLESYDFVFKVDSDVLLPLDYAISLASEGLPVAGFGPAMLISTWFLARVLRGRYPVNHCDDGYLLAVNVALTGRVGRYAGGGQVILPDVEVIKDREFAYGVEYYKWGVTPPLLILLPLTRIFLKVTKRMKRFQDKPLKAFLYNYAGYLHAWLTGWKRYWFHESYARMRTLQLFKEFMGK